MNHRFGGSERSLNKMADYYKDGFLEAVMFAFYKNGKILIEHRPSKNNDEKEAFIPNGRIDRSDLNKNDDYRIVALKREINEEFNNNVKPLKFKYVMTFIVEKLKIRFYVYLVAEWSGEMPKFTVENSKKFADLEWIKLKDYKKHLTLPSAVSVCENIIEKMG